MEHLSSAFQKDQEPVLRERMNIILLMGCILMPVFSLTDYLLYPDYFPRFVIYRIIDAFCCFCLLLINLKWDLKYKSFYLGTAAYYIVGGSIIKMIIDVGGYATPYYAGLCLVFLGFASVLTVGFHQFVWHTVILYGLYVGSVTLINQPDQVNLFMGNNMFLGSSVIIVLVAAFANYRLRYKEYLTRTELKKTQAILEQYSRTLEHSVAASEAKYQHVVENANEAIVIYQDDYPKFFNAKALEVFGFSSKEFSSKPFFENVHPADRSMFLDWHRKRLNGDGVPHLNEFRILDSAGNEKWVQTSAVPVDWEGTPATLSLMNDITDRVLARREIEDLEKRLNQAEKMEALGTLAGGIAHDFNNILSVVIGYSEVSMDDVPKGGLLGSNLQQILKAGRRARDLVKQILAFSRQTEQERRPLEISPVVKETLKLLRASLPATIEIKQDIESCLGSVLTDPTQINQIVMNLCTNAAHAMRQKGGTLHVRVHNVDLDTSFVNRFPDMEPGSYVRLTVTDDGHGMTREVKERIFDPYFTTKATGEGTGLGLAVVHGIIRSHGGMVTVLSEPEKGSTFHVYLPTIDMDVETEARPNMDTPKGSEKILLIDDEQAVVGISKQILERLGYVVDPWTSSTEALAAFRQKPDDFDLVITDMTMPKITGEELTKELMRIRPDIPVILCTGYSKRITEEKAKAIGIKAFVMKPIHTQVMAETVRHVLDGCA